MLKERADFMRTVLFVAELVMASLNFFAVYLLFLHVDFLHEHGLLSERFAVPTPAPIAQYMPAFWLALGLWTAILRARGEYQHFRLQTYLKIISNQVLNAALFFGFYTSAAFLLKLQELSRLFIVVYTVTTLLELLVVRLAVLSLAYYVRKKGYNYRNLILVGTGRRAQEFISLAAKHAEWGYRIIGLLDVDPEKRGKRIAGHPVIGTLEDLPKLLEENVVDEVVFVVPRSWIGAIEKCILYCEAVGVPATLSTDFFNLDIASGRPRSMESFTYITFETRLLKASELVVKRFCDVLLSSAGLLLTAPLMLGTALAVKFTSPGPVLFRQVRSGRNGRRFVLYKFRSMVIDAEERLEELRDKNEMSGPVFKMSEDPRLTKVGKFLRKTSLDELPQLWNVFRGDMSLVGPRPPLPREVEQYEPWQRRRLSMKPGITCIWQISGRNEVDFEDWMKMDLQYIDRWSLWLDIKIILLTVWAVVLRRGAR